MVRTVGVIGGGAWGTALAQTLRCAGLDVLLWARESEVVAEINGQHTNSHFLPGIALDPALRATGNLAEIAERSIVLMAALAVLSGPSFAIDVARALPAALTLATQEEALGRQLAETLGYRHFRLYWSSDIVGVQLGGAVKNVLAIAAGVVDGKGLGASAHAALVTRGFAELRRLGSALGARPETLMGLSGLGDLLLTCGSPQSRNMSLGRALGQGQALAAVLGGRRSVAEGVYTAAAVVRVAAENAIEMPICESVHGIVQGALSVSEAIEALLSRPFKA